MNVLEIPKSELVVQFEGHLRPFRLRQYHCNNPDCDCNDATLEFTEAEKNGSGIRNPISFRFRLNLEKWQKSDSKTYDEPITALIEEFVRDLSAETKAYFLKYRDSWKNYNKKLANFTMPTEDIRQGILISFSEVMSDGEYDGFPAFGYKFDYEGQTHFFDDLYCPNPKCDCNTVHLIVLNEDVKSDNKTILSQKFHAQISLNDKGIEVEDLRKCSQIQAQAIIYQWLQTEPNALKVCKGRYKEIRKITKKILKANSVPHESIKTAAAPLPAAGIARSVLPNKGFSSAFKIGRNDLCPCGSGKKYKKCCG